MSPKLSMYRTVLLRKGRKLAGLLPKGICMGSACLHKPLLLLLFFYSAETQANCSCPSQ